MAIQETKYKEDYPSQLIEHMSNGRSFESFGASCFVCKETLYNWLEKHAEFKQAYGIAKMRCQAWWEQQLLDNLKDKTFNTVGYLFTMKCRFGYRDGDDNKTGVAPIKIELVRASDANKSS